MNKIKFPKETREKWLKALRGGRYKQVDGMLCSTSSDSYCCLGVLGRVMGIEKKKLMGHGDFSSLEMPFEITCKVPKALVITNKKEKTSRNTKFANHLISMNDDEGKSFLEIADYIEKATIGV